MVIPKHFTLEQFRRLIERLGLIHMEEEAWASRRRKQRNSGRLEMLKREYIAAQEARANGTDGAGAGGDTGPTTGQLPGVQETGGIGGGDHAAVESDNKGAA